MKLDELRQSLEASSLDVHVDATAGRQVVARRVSRRRVGRAFVAGVAVVVIAAAGIGLWPKATSRRVVAGPSPTSGKPAVSRTLPPPTPSLPRTVVSAAMNGNDVYSLNALTHEGMTTVGDTLTRYERASGAVAASRPIEGSQVVAAAGHVWIVDVPEVSELDPSTLATVRTFGIGGAAVRLAASGDRVFVANNQAQLIRITPSTGETRVVLEHSGMIGDVALDPAGQRLYVAAGYKVLRLDPASGKVLARTADIPSVADGLGLLSVDEAGVWLTYPGGMMSASVRLSPMDLRDVTPTMVNPVDQRFGNRPYVIANGSSFWLVGEVDPRVVGCGDTLSGRLRSTAVVGNAMQVVADAAGVVGVGPDGIRVATGLSACG
jgi:hypothetical protein